MSGESDVIRGAIKLDSLVSGCCFTSWEDFVKAIPTLFSVEVPATITNVVISNLQPGSSLRDNLWIRLDNSGSFMGLFIYTGGLWQQIFPTPQGIFKMYGDSRVIPSGYLLADTSNPHLTAGEAAALMASWVLHGSGLYYTIFDVTYEGF